MRIKILTSNTNHQHTVNINMEKIIPYLLNGMSLLAMSLMFGFIMSLIMKGRDSFEKLIRTIALSAGLLLFLESKKLGISIPLIILTSIDSMGVFSGYAISLAGSTIAGYIVTTQLFKSIDKDGKDGFRRIYLLILISTLTLLMFADVYLGSTSDDSEKNLIFINLSFSFGVIFSLLFDIETTRNFKSYVLGHKNISQDEITIKKKPSWKDHL